MGYGPGVVLYTIFGVLAGYSGFLLWKCFLGLDSDRYPLSSYGDMAFRIFGSWARHLVNFLQSIQLLINVAIIIVVNGQSLEEIVQGSGHDSVCYIILIFVWAIAGKGLEKLIDKFAVC
jgi:amino acid permease